MNVAARTTKRLQHDPALGIVWVFLKWQSSPLMTHLLTHSQISQSSQILLPTRDQAFKHKNLWVHCQSNQHKYIRDRWQPELSTHDHVPQDLGNYIFHIVSHHSSRKDHINEIHSQAKEDAKQVHMFWQMANERCIPMVLNTAQSWGILLCCPAVFLIFWILISLLHNSSVNLPY